jgi:UDP-glucose 4-epimerase
MAQATGRAVPFERGSVCDRRFVAAALARHRIEAVMHFAAFKSSHASFAAPLEYYHNNVGGLTALLGAMDEAGCRRLVFSSSAAVYGEPDRVPVNEHMSLRHTNPYAHTKVVCEELLAACRAADPRWSIAIARYFNPAGAHPSGLIGEDPARDAYSLMQRIARVAAAELDALDVFGTDYPTFDGTGVRDFVHVMDLAEGHVALLQHLERTASSVTLNLGMGRGHSVLEVVRAFEVASGRKVTLRAAPRRAGDVAACYADASRARAVLGWRTTRSLHEMCASALAWQRNRGAQFAAARCA